MATKRRNSWQLDQGGTIESMMSSLLGSLAQKGVEEIFDAIISDDDDDDLPLKGAERMLCKTLSVAAGGLAQKGAQVLFEELGWGNEKTRKALESKTDEASQELMKTVKALQECVKELQESRQCESLLLRAYLEKYEGWGNEEKTTKVLESKTDEASQELMKTVKALQEHVKELQESRQCESLLLRAYLEKNQRWGNEEKTTKVLESKTDEASQELMKTVKALQECVKELQESRQREAQLRAKLEKYEGKKKEEISDAEAISEFQQLLKRIGTLEESLQKLPESSA